MRRAKTLFAAGLFGATSLSLGGCIPPSPGEVNQTPQYQMGYNDGCNTALKRRDKPKALVRDQDDWDNSEDYRSGWRNGYGNCKDPQAGGSANTLFPEVFNDPGAI